MASRASVERMPGPSRLTASENAKARSRESAGLQENRTVLLLSEVKRDREPREPRLEDRRRVVPGAAARHAVVVLRLVGRRLVAVEDVPEIDADVRARLTIPDDLRDPHIDLIP